MRRVWGSLNSLELPVVAGVLSGLMLFSGSLQGSDGKKESSVPAADVVVSYNVQLSSGETLGLSSVLGEPAILRADTSDELIGLIPHFSDDSEGEVIFEVLRLREEEPRQVLGRGLPVGELIVRRVSLGDERGLGLGEAIELFSGSIGSLRLDSISFRAPQGNRGSKKRPAGVVSGDLLLVDDLCCAVCSSGIGGCGASVTTSCGATCSTP